MILMDTPCHLKGKGKIHFENLYQVQTTHEIMHSYTKKTYATPLIH
jgi:hypothetical protein